MILDIDISDLPTPYSLDQLNEMYKQLNERTKERVLIAFNKEFLYKDDDTTFTNLMEGKMMLCYDEYVVLCNQIKRNYDFFIWAKSQYKAVND